MIVFARHVGGTPQLFARLFSCAHLHELPRTGTKCASPPRRSSSRSSSRWPRRHAHRKGCASGAGWQLAPCYRRAAHLQGRHEVGVIVADTLQPADMADRAERCAADLPNPLGNIIRGGENLISLLVQQEMIITEMGPRHVPMKVLRLHIEGEHVSKENRERTGNIVDGISFQVGWRFERSRPECCGVIHV